MYIKWAETHKQSNKMRLNDMLVKPHQRLTKYPLLLKAILKHTQQPSVRDTLTQTIAVVERFIGDINTWMRRREERKELLLLSARIQAYDVVESGNEEVERVSVTGRRGGECERE
uniref:DH domain-containing protein n=1 Tax=Callorhinchus milii TaxID=7868 RepID=A0A4W3H2M8_CALMI